MNMIHRFSRGTPKDSTKKSFLLWETYCPEVWRIIQIWLSVFWRGSCAFQKKICSADWTIHWSIRYLMKNTANTSALPKMRFGQWLPTTIDRRQWTRFASGMMDTVSEVLRFIIPGLLQIILLPEGRPSHTGLTPVIMISSGRFWQDSHRSLRMIWLRSCRVNRYMQHWIWKLCILEWRMEMTRFLAFYCWLAISHLPAGRRRRKSEHLHPSAFPTPRYGGFTTQKF